MARPHPGLTDRQRELLVFIVDYVDQHDRPPTMREMCSHMRIASTNGVSDHLKALEKKGYLKRDPLVSRGIKVLPEGLAAALTDDQPTNECLENDERGPWALVGTLGRFVTVYERLADDQGERVLELKVLLRVVDFDGVQALATTTWHLPESTIPARVAASIVDKATELLRHEVVEALRYDKRQVYLAHAPDGSFTQEFLLAHLPARASSPRATVVERAAEPVAELQPKPDPVRW